MTTGQRILGGSFVLALAAFASSCTMDPVHEAAVNSLGEENANEYPPESNWHRPGEPCALCHSKKGPAESEFWLGGTVYWARDSDHPAANVYVRILDGSNSVNCFVTNCAGNFWLRKGGLFGIQFPLLISIERTKEPGVNEETLVIRRMASHVSREGSCATCHIKGLHDFASPDRIYLYPTDDEVPPEIKDSLPVSCPDPSINEQIQCPQ